MSDPILKSIDQLSDAFSLIADRAPWVRAHFGVQVGRFNFYEFGRPGESYDDESGFVSAEVHSLTSQAGEVAADMTESGRLRLRIPVSYEFCDPQEFWLAYLVYSETRGYCYVDRPGGAKVGAEAILGIGDDQVGVWIDNYPRVCVIALGWLKAKAMRPFQPKVVEQGGTPRTQLRIESKQVFLNNEPVPMGFTPERTEDALAFIGELLREPGNWKSSSDIGKATNREGVRFDRIFKVLPATIKSLIASDRRKGYRLKPWRK